MTCLEKLNQDVGKYVGKNEMFGGVPVIVLGDLYQVSPVAGEMIFTQAVPKGKKANAYQVVASGNMDNNYLWARFELYELTEIIRQRDDRKFAVALNKIAQDNIIGLNE